MIEEFADLWDMLPRIAARMFATLLITGAELSSHELVERLGVSSASVSTMGRLLVKSGFVERRVSPETRRDLFHVPDDVWEQLHKRDEGFLTNINDWLSRAVSFAGQRHNGAVPPALEEMRNFYTYVEDQYPSQAARYHHWKTTRGLESPSSSE